MNVAEILRQHKLWLIDDEAGECADLIGSDLRGADLRGSDLRGADLRGSDLRGADLRGSDLRRADLIGSDLRRADLRDSDLSRADLRNTNLIDSDLRRADLRGSDLRYAIGNGKEVMTIICGEKTITYTQTEIYIACVHFSIKELFNLTDEVLATEYKDHLDWWSKWKETLRLIINTSGVEL